LHAREGQSFRFCTHDDLPDGPLLPATVPVLRWLALPPVYAISNAHELGAALFLQRLEIALERGLRFLQFREPHLDPTDAELLFRMTLQRVRAVSGLLVVSSRHPHPWSLAADGVHLTSSDLMAANRRPECEWVGASAHGEVELAHAAAIGVDFVVLGPVSATASHPGSKGMGWHCLARWIAATAVPVYAIGGLNAGDLQRARDAGAHGVALQRAAWLEV
jgi:8-oxo-dGTP diphosphatase